MFRSVITQGWGSVWPCSRSRGKMKDQLLGLDEEMKLIAVNFNQQIRKRGRLANMSVNDNHLYC